MPYLTAAEFKIMQETIKISSRLKKACDKRRLKTLKEYRIVWDLLVSARDVLDNYSYTCVHGDGSQIDNEDVQDMCRKIDSYLDGSPR